MAVEELVEAIKAASLYRLEEAGPIMAQVYLDHSKGKPHLVNMVAYAAARYRSDAAESLQRRLLADPASPTPTYRVPLLMALADRGDDDAARTLHAWVVQVLAEIENDGTASGDLGRRCRSCAPRACSSCCATRRARRAGAQDLRIAAATLGRQPTHAGRAPGDHPARAGGQEAARA
jgi:hypothetical protein